MASSNLRRLRQKYKEDHDSHVHFKIVLTTGNVVITERQNLSTLPQNFSLREDELS